MSIEWCLIVIGTVYRDPQKGLELKVRHFGLFFVKISKAPQFAHRHPTMDVRIVYKIVTSTTTLLLLLSNTCCYNFY